MLPVATMRFERVRTHIQLCEWFSGTKVGIVPFLFSFSFSSSSFFPTGTGLQADSISSLAKEDLKWGLDLTEVGSDL